jgi:diacylglycerol kinase (ATP)
MADARGDERVRDLEQERGRAAEQEERLAVQPSRYGVAREDAGVTHTSSVPLLRAFGYAFAGLAYLMRTQTNFRIEVAIAVVAVIAGVWARFERWEWTLLLLTIVLVLSLEALNTAIEDAVTLASPRLDPRAKVAKDVAAAGVLIGATAAVGVGILLFGPRLTAMLGY